MKDLSNPPSLKYEHWSGKQKLLDIKAGDWPNPPDKYYYSVDWINLGWAPAARNDWQNFKYHLGQGLAMQYPLLSVVVFAWRYRKNWRNEIPKDWLVDDNN